MTRQSEDFRGRADLARPWLSPSSVRKFFTPLPSCEGRKRDSGKSEPKGWQTPRPKRYIVTGYDIGIKVLDKDPIALV